MNIYGVFLIMKRGNLQTTVPRFEFIMLPTEHLIEAFNS